MNASGVTRGRTAPGGDIEGKQLWTNFQRIVEKLGRTGKKVLGDTLQGGDTQVKSIKSYSDEQRKVVGFS